MWTVLRCAAYGMCGARAQRPVRVPLMALPVPVCGGQDRGHARNVIVPLVVMSLLLPPPSCRPLTTVGASLDEHPN